MEALRRHLVDNLIGSCVWGLTFMYIRKMGNPEIRHTAWKNTQVGREGGRERRREGGFLRVGLDLYVYPQDGQPGDSAHGLEEHAGREGGRDGEKDGGRVSACGA